MTITDPAEYRRIHDIAAAAYEAAVPVDYRYSALALRKAVDAALSASKPVAEAVKVKPLEWQMLPPPFATGPLRPTARMPLGTYTITEIFVGKDEHITWFSLLEGSAVGSGPTQDHAKAAAQDDYEQRIMSALIPQEQKKDG